LNVSSYYHLEADGQIESTNQILKDMLRACVKSSEVSEMMTYPYWNFLTTIVTSSSLKWPYLRHYMDESTKLLSVEVT